MHLEMEARLAGSDIAMKERNALGFFSLFFFSFLLFYFFF